MKTVVIHSGGLDSTVLLYSCIARDERVAALRVHYGQRHTKELSAAEAICRDLGIERREADLQPAMCIFNFASALTDAGAQIPEGHYADESMKVTVIPNRNMIMLSVAIGWAIGLKYDRVAFGAHAGDHPIYPDCRPEFTAAMNAAALLSSGDGRVSVEAPFSRMNKTSIVRLGVQLNAPFGKTWSCYKGGELHCGKCGTCVERKEAFRDAGVFDPTEYEG